MSALRSSKTIALLALLLACCVSAANVNHNNEPLGGMGGTCTPYLNFTVEHTTSDYSVQRVRAFWGCVPGDGSGDVTGEWVSVWWEPLHATYIQYANVTASGPGSAVFSLLNARHRYVFRYFRGNNMLMESAAVQPKRHVPLQMRLTFPDDDPTKMRVSWVSDRVLANSSVVRIGTSPMRLSRVVAVQNWTTITKEELNAAVELPPIQTIQQPFANIGSRSLRCGQDCYNDYTSCSLFVDAGVLMSAVVDSLVPGKTYYYQVGESGGGGIMSAVRSFRARVAPSAAATVNILYVADGGIGGIEPGFEGSAIHNDPPANGAKRVWESLRREIAAGAVRYDMAISNGDVSYGRGWSYIWEIYANQTSRGLFDVVPMIVTMGNHEQDSYANKYNLARGGDSGGEAGIVTSKRFNMPHQDGSWYRRTFGPVTFIGLNSEYLPEPQRAFLRDIIDNKRINRTATPWLVVFLHRPIFTTMCPSTDDYTEHLKASFADLLVEVGADLVLAGHEHYYERMAAISSGAANVWGYRDVWTFYDNSVINSENATQCNLGRSFFVLSVDECRVKCARSATCTAIQLSDANLKCQLLKCPIAFDTHRSFFGAAIMTLTRLPGNAPVFINDGTAGAEFSYPFLKDDPVLRFREVKKWGYSTMKINATTLHWRHFHAVSRFMSDEIVLSSPNVKA